MQGKVKTRQNIADEYGINPRTLKRWLKKEKIEIPPGLITPVYQEIIYRKFGKPKITA